MTANKFQKYLVGTLFDEEQQDKKTNLSNIKAKDPMGNTRWKGAFTGGFEAGYKNTCGSKDGWAPASFVSSIYKKADATERTIFDYMDKEDLGRESITQNITLNQNFQIAKSESLNISLQQSIGEKILNKLKKAEAHRTAPQCTEQLDKLFQIYAKEEQKQKPSYQLTDLIQPISVGGTVANLSIDEFVDAYEDFYKKVIREQGKEETQEQIKKRREQNKIYFDFTKPLQEEPEYLKEIQQIEQAEKPRKRKKNLINQQNLKSIYTPSFSFKQFHVAEQLEKAPADYDPYARMRGLQTLGRKQPEKQVKHHRALTVESRSQMLGETKLSSKFVSSQNSLANKFVSTNQKTKELIKFFEEQKKNMRYHEYVEEMQGKKISSQLTYQSYQEAERQRHEFQEMYQKQKSINQKLAKEGIKPIKQADTQKEQKVFYINRNIQSWRPEKLLCKRYSLLMPYTVARENPQKQMNYS